jgi:hypothetical protein
MLGSFAWGRRADDLTQTAPPVTWPFYSFQLLVFYVFLFKNCKQKNFENIFKISSYAYIMVKIEILYIMSHTLEHN